MTANLAGISDDLEQNGPAVSRSTIDFLLQAGPYPALLGLKLGLTYRYDNRREGIVGWDPSRKTKSKQAARVLSTLHQSG